MIETAWLVAAALNKVCGHCGRALIRHVATIIVEVGANKAQASSNYLSVVTIWGQSLFKEIRYALSQFYPLPSLYLLDDNFWSDDSPYSTVTLSYLH